MAILCMMHAWVHHKNAPTVIDLLQQLLYPVAMPKQAIRVHRVSLAFATR